tara:strand:+ start:157 stop:309 length:153 start_codon:yes stop_codon:yes gene_type:complete
MNMEIWCAEYYDQFGKRIIEWNINPDRIEAELVAKGIKAESIDVYLKDVS